MENDSADGASSTESRGAGTMDDQRTIMHTMEAARPPLRSFAPRPMRGHDDEP